MFHWVVFWPKLSALSVLTSGSVMPAQPRGHGRGSGWQQIQQATFGSCHCFISVASSTTLAQAFVRLHTDPCWAAFLTKKKPTEPKSSLPPGLFFSKINSLIWKVPWSQKPLSQEENDMGLKSQWKERAHIQTAVPERHITALGAQQSY